MTWSRITILQWPFFKDASFAMHVAITVAVVVADGTVHWLAVEKTSLSRRKISLRKSMKNLLTLVGKPRRKTEGSIDEKSPNPIGKLGKKTEASMTSCW